MFGIICLQQLTIQNKYFPNVNFYSSVLDSDHNGYLDFKVKNTKTGVGAISTSAGGLLIDTDSIVKSYTFIIGLSVNSICRRNFSRRLI